MLSALLLFLFSIPAIIFEGFVLSQLWQWFITPLGVVSIGIAQGIGIALLVGLLTSKVNAATNPEMTGWMLAISQIVAFLFVWGFGAIVHLFM